MAVGVQLIAASNMAGHSTQAAVEVAAVRSIVGRPGRGSSTILPKLLLMVRIHVVSELLLLYHLETLGQITRLLLRRDVLRAAAVVPVRLVLVLSILLAVTLLAVVGWSSLRRNRMCVGCTRRTSVGVAPASSLLGWLDCLRFLGRLVVDWLLFARARAGSSGGSTSRGLCLGFGKLLGILPCLCLNFLLFGRIFGNNRHQI